MYLKATIVTVITFRTSIFSRYYNTLDLNSIIRIEKVKENNNRSSNVYFDTLKKPFILIPYILYLNKLNKPSLSLEFLVSRIPVLSDKSQ